MSLRPAERRERPERRREPRVEHVGLARQLGRAALGARVGLGLLAPSGGRPGTSRPGSGGPTRAAARCSSRARSRATRSRSGAGSRGGRRSRRSRSACERGLLELVHRAPPLQRDARLDARLAALADARRCAGSARAPRAGRARCSQSRIRSSASFCVSPSRPSARDEAVGPDAARLRQAVVAADREVGRSRDRA